MKRELTVSELVDELSWFSAAHQDQKVQVVTPDGDTLFATKVITDGEGYVCIILEEA